MLRYVAHDGRRHPDGQLMFGTDTSRAVVVGVDGSPDSTAALDLAAEEATTRGVPLLIVHSDPGVGTDEPDEATRALVRAAVERIHTTHPDLEIINDAAGGGSLLVGFSRDALVVVGREYAGSFASEPAGVVTGRLVEQVRCPVIVAGDGPTPAQPRIVVGVDDTSASLDALQFAARWSARHGWPVDAVHVVPDIDLRGIDADTASNHRMRVSMWLWDRVGDAARNHPRASIRIFVAFGEKPAPALLKAAEDATLVVIAARRPALGAIGFTLVDEANCPVAIVPRGR